MKPIILVDKSFIQSLSIKEADTLKTHFSILVTPILLQEMITDTVKRRDSGDEIEKLKILADKVGGGGQLTITDARILFHASLDGCKFGTKLGIPVFNPKEVRAPDGSIGCIIEETFEEKLIIRWQNKIVLEEDIIAANNYFRDFLIYYSVNRHQELADEFPINNQFTRLDDLVAFVDSVSLRAKEAPMYVESVSKMTRTPSEIIEKARIQWERNGKSQFESLYPYAFYFIRLFLIYSLGLTNGLIPASKQDNAVHDIQYFLYLPFCHAFCSQDRFHEECFKYFQRPEQMFIWAPDFKKDLESIGKFFDSLDDEGRINYSRHRGSYPPSIPDSISVSIWCKVRGPWQEGRFGNRAVDMREDEQKKVVDEIKNIFKDGK